MLALTAPLRLGRPPADAKVPSLNAIITRNAAAHGALVVDLGDFGARNQVMVDYVHPTAFGQIAIAERALAVLAADGLPARLARGADLLPDHPLAPAARRSDLRLPRPQAAHPGGGRAARGAASAGADVGRTVTRSDRAPLLTARRGPRGGVIATCSDGISIEEHPGPLRTAARARSDVRTPRREAIECAPN